MGKSRWGGYHDFIGNGFSWSKWQYSSGTLARILLMEQIAHSVGYLDSPFAGRLEQEPPQDSVERFHFLTCGDEYPTTTVRGVTSYAATTRLTDIGGPSAVRLLKPHWEQGCMPRQPVEFDKWSEGVYVGSTALGGTGYDHEEWKRRQAEREVKQKAEEDAKHAAERAQRAAERNAIWREAQVTIDEHSAENARKQQALASELRHAQKEAAAAAQLAAASQAAAANRDDLLCTVCMDANKDACLEPCKHVCVCVACAAALLKTRSSCPLCRTSVTGATRVFI